MSLFKVTLLWWSCFGCQSSLHWPPSMPSARQCDEFSLSVICRSCWVLSQPSAACCMNTEHLCVCVWLYFQHGAWHYVLLYLCECACFVCVLNSDSVCVWIKLGRWLMSTLCYPPHIVFACLRDGRETHLSWIKHDFRHTVSRKQASAGWYDRCACAWDNNSSSIS